MEQTNDHNSDAERVAARLQDGDIQVFDEYQIQWGEPIGNPVHTIPYRINFPDESSLESKVTIT